MSHYCVVQTKMTDAKALAKALGDMDFKNVEVNATAQHLEGFAGGTRPQTAEVIIRRKQLSWLSNDIGFKRGPKGNFEAVISDYDLRWYSAEWLDRLSQRYAYHVALDKLAEKGFALASEQTQSNGQIHLVLRRMG
jgi:hypothetical protein